MLKNSYKLDDSTFTSIENGQFDYLYNWEFCGRWVNHKVVDLENATSENYGAIAYDVDDFLFISCGYSQGFSICRADETSETISLIYQNGTYAGNSLALDKTRKRAYVGVYNSSGIYEYDYSDIYYSGGTTCTVNTLTSADGFQDEYIGLGSRGASFVIAGDYLYYNLGNTYPSGGQFQRWNLSTRSGDSIPWYNRNNSSGGYKGVMWYDEPNDRIFVFFQAGFADAGILVITSASTSGATCYTIPHSSFNILPSYICTCVYEPDEPNILWLGYGQNYWNKVDITPCLASTSGADYIRPTLYNLPSQTGAYSAAEAMPDWNSVKTGGLYYINRHYYTLSSGRTFISQNLYETYSLGFDKINLQRFGMLDVNFTNSKDPSKRATAKNISCDVTPNVYNSIYHATGVFKNIYPSTLSGSTYTWNTGTTWSMDQFAHRYTRLTKVSEEEHYIFETGSTLLFADGMSLYKRVSDDLIINGDFDSDTGWTKSSNVYTDYGKIYKTGTTSNGYAYQEIELSIGKTYEIEFEFHSVRTSDNYGFYFSFGSNSNIDYITYGSTTGNAYCTPTSLNYNRFYFTWQQYIEGNLEFVRLYEVEKAPIKSCYISNLVDNVYFPSTAATMTVLVSADGGVNWEEYDYKSTKQHIFTHNGFDFQVKFVATGDEINGPAYIQSIYKLEVTLYGDSDERKSILRSDGKIIRANGKIIRV